VFQLIKCDLRHMFQLILKDSEFSIYRYKDRKTNNLICDTINNANEIAGIN
jgi:hypothetical protein